MLPKPVVLKIFTTRAPAAHFATSSPPDVVVPTSRPSRPGRNGLVTSSKIFPLRLSEGSTVLAASQGRALTITSAKTAASAAEAAFACPSDRRRIACISEAAGSRTPNIISWPRLAHPAPSVPPTFPPPKIPIFIRSPQRAYLGRMPYHQKWRYVLLTSVATWRKVWLGVIYCC